MDTTNRLRVEYFAKEKKAKVYVNGKLVTEVDVSATMVVEADFDPKHFQITNLLGGSID